MAETPPPRLLRRTPGDMSPKEEKRKNQIVLDSDDEGTAARTAVPVASASPEEPPGGETLPENPEEDQLNLERAAMAFLRNRGYCIEETQGDGSAIVQHRCRAFQKLALWVSSTVPPVLDELQGALGPLAQCVSLELARLEGDNSAKRFNARYQDLLRRDRRRSKHDQHEGKREVFMSEFSHNLLLSYLGRPDMTCLLDIFFDLVRVTREPRQSTAGIFCESALIAAADDKSKKRKATSSKTVPLPSKLSAVKDKLHRPISIVSLVVDAPDVGVGSISEDQRFCVAGCDRDVRIFRAEKSWGLCTDAALRLEGERLGSHGGRVLSTAFAPNSEFLLSGGQDGCIQLWNTRTSALTTYRQVDPVWCLDWAPLGHYFVSSGKDGEALLWSVSDKGKAPLRVYGSPGPEVQALRVQPDGRRVVTAHCDSFVFWDLASAVPTRIMREGSQAAVTSMAFSMDGNSLAAGLEDGCITFLDLRASRPTVGSKASGKVRPAHRAAVSALCWSKVKTKEHRDMLFSSSGSHMLIREMSGFRQLEKTEVKLAMDHVLCSHASVGHTLVLGASF